MKTILCLPDSFKGSLSAQAFCALLETEMAKQLPFNWVAIPLSDGGEGFIAALTDQPKHLLATNIMGIPTSVTYYWQDKQTAVLELAQVVGLDQVPIEQRKPLLLNTLAMGQLIRTMYKQGARHILLGLGGSATNDFGLGILSALGIEAKNNLGQTVHLPQDYKTIAAFEKTTAFLPDLQFTLACDVRNTVCGPQGASHVFGPQKGLTPAECTYMDDAFSHLVQLLEKQTQHNISQLEGGGAAGGIGAGLAAFYPTQFVSGFQVIAQHHQLAAQIKKADYIITGEGCFDSSSMQGKATGQVLALSKKHHKPVLLVCGQNKATRPPSGVHILPLFDREVDEASIQTQTRQLIVEKTRNFIKSNWI